MQFHETEAKLTGLRSPNPSEVFLLRDASKKLSCITQGKTPQLDLSGKIHKLRGFALVTLQKFL